MYTFEKCYTDKIYKGYASSNYEQNCNNYQYDQQKSSYIPVISLRYLISSLSPVFTGILSYELMKTGQLLEPNVSGAEKALFGFGMLAAIPILSYKYNIFLKSHDLLYNIGKLDLLQNIAFEVNGYIDYAKSFFTSSEDQRQIKTEGNSHNQENCQPHSQIVEVKEQEVEILGDEDG